MKYPNHMTASEAQQIEYDVISDDLRIHLTRVLRGTTKAHDADIHLINQNNMINRSRTIAGKTIYVLEADDGNYTPQEHAWHNGEMELVFRRLSTPELAEFLAELAQDGFLDECKVNELLEKEGSSFRLKRKTRFAIDTTVSVEVLSLESLEESERDADAHPNIRVLVHRMDTALNGGDFAGVLHASASIFETLAKIVVARPTVENQSLKAFFDRYRKDSKLPEAVLDYILSVYDERNTTPLAGHGATELPAIGRDQATVLSEMTKAFVRIEYRLSRAAQ